MPNPADLQTPQPAPFAIGPEAPPEPDPESRILSALARMPKGRPLTPRQAWRIADGQAFVAAGGRGRTSAEVVAAARTNLGRTP